MTQQSANGFNCTHDDNRQGNKQSNTHADKINPYINSGTVCRTSMEGKKALKSHNMLF